MDDADVKYLKSLANDIASRSGWYPETPQRIRRIADRLAVALNPERYRCDPIESASQKDNGR